MKEKRNITIKNDGYSLFDFMSATTIHYIELYIMLWIGKPVLTILQIDKS